MVGCWGWGGRGGWVYDKNNATPKIELTRFSARLRIQDGADCGNKEMSAVVSMPGSFKKILWRFNLKRNIPKIGGCVGPAWVGGQTKRK